MTPNPSFQRAALPPLTKSFGIQTRHAKFAHDVIHWPKTAAVMKRLICGLLATTFLASLIIGFVKSLSAAQVPTAGFSVGGIATFMVSSVFGWYALDNGR